MLPNDLPSEPADAPSSNPPLTFGHRQGVDLYVSKRYTSRDQKFVDQRERATLRKLIKRHLSNQVVSSVLDVPCGYGRMMPLLNEVKIGYSWADISPSMVEYVGERDDNCHSGSGYEGVVSKLPIADKQFDAILSIRLFQHFADVVERLAGLRELRRITKNLAVISFYDSASLHAHTKNWFARQQGKRSTRITFLTRSQFVAEAEEMGFKVVTIRAWARFFHAHSYAVLVRV